MESNEIRQLSINVRLFLTVTVTIIEKTKKNFRLSIKRIMLQQRSVHPRDRAKHRDRIYNHLTIKDVPDDNHKVYIKNEEGPLKV